MGSNDPTKHHTVTNKNKINKSVRNGLPLVELLASEVL